MSDIDWRSIVYGWRLVLFYASLSVFIIVFSLVSGVYLQHILGLGQSGRGAEYTYTLSLLCFLIYVAILFKSLRFFMKKPCKGRGYSHKHVVIGIIAITILLLMGFEYVRQAYDKKPQHAFLIPVIISNIMGPLSIIVLITSSSLLLYYIFTYRGFNSTKACSATFLSLALFLITAYAFINYLNNRACSDGTLYGKCNTPYKCSNGVLVKDTGHCGCPEHQIRVVDDCETIARFDFMRIPCSVIGINSWGIQIISNPESPLVLVALTNYSTLGCEEMWVGGDSEVMAFLIRVNETVQDTVMNNMRIEEPLYVLYPYEEYVIVVPEIRRITGKTDESIDEIIKYITTRLENDTLPPKSKQKPATVEDVWRKTNYLAQITHWSGPEEDCRERVGTLKVNLNGDLYEVTFPNNYGCLSCRDIPDVRINKSTGEFTAINVDELCLD